MVDCLVVVLYAIMGDRAETFIFFMSIGGVTHSQYHCSSDNRMRYFAIIFMGSSLRNIDCVTNDLVMKDRRRNSATMRSLAARLAHSADWRTE